MVILAEVKVKDGDAYQVRLFNMSLKAFRNMADKRFVQIGRTIQIDDLNYVLGRMYGLITEEPRKGWSKK